MPRKRQQGGVIPLAAIMPAIVAAGKAAALGVIGSAARHQTKKWLDAKQKRYKKRQTQTKNRFKHHAWREFNTI